MDIRVQVYQHKKTGAIRVADHPPGQIKDWVELYHFIHEVAYLLDNRQEKSMKPLGNEKQDSLSRKWTKALRKADKAKGRQAAKRKLEKFNG